MGKRSGCSTATGTSSPWERCNWDCSTWKRGTCRAWRSISEESKPLLLNSAIREDNSLFTVDATNLDTQLSDTTHLPQGTIHIFRSTSLSNGVLHLHFRFQNYGLQVNPVWLAFLFDADFADIFEVRGTPRKQRGERLPDRVEEQALVLGYEGSGWREAADSRFVFACARSDSTGRKLRSPMKCSPTRSGICR